MKPHLRSSARFARLSLERLEERETPAGVVTVSLINNTISFLGDGNVSGNEVKVTATTNNHFLIEGQNGTTFILNKKNVGATIDTAALPPGNPVFVFPNNGTTKLMAKFLAGPDRFEYDGFANALLPRQFADISLDMGMGNDTVLATQFVAKNMTILSTLPTGAITDNDNVTIAAGGQLDLIGAIPGPETYLGGIKGNLTITGQTGSDATLLALTIGGNVTGTFVDAGDNFTIRGGSRIGGNVTLTETAGKLLGNNTINVMESTQIGKNFTVNNLGNSLDATLQNSRIGGNVVLNAGSGTTGSLFNLTNLDVGGNFDVKDGALVDALSMNGITIAKNLTLSMGDGGNGAGDTLQSLVVNGNLTVTYGKGADFFSLQNSTINGNATITNTDGVDRLQVLNTLVGRNFSYNGGNGGTQTGLNRDAINGVTVGGTLSMTYGTGNDELQLDNARIHGVATFRTGDGANLVQINTSQFFGALNITGGIAVDTVNCSNTMVFGVTNVNTAAGADVINITQSGRYKGKVTLNTGASIDTINVEADLGQETTFLGGVSVTTGTEVDVTTAGFNGAGFVIIMNTLTYPDAANLSDTVNLGNNLLIL
jgi:hypothetical protein